MRAAGALCARVQRGEGFSRRMAGGDGGRGAREKEDASPVTVADYAAQAVVSELLARSLPGPRPPALVAEEDADSLRNDPDLLVQVTGLVNEALAEAPREVGGGGPPLSEEGVLAAVGAGGHPGGSEGRVWVLDPIDGTRGFVAGRQYCVALALLDQGEAVLGVLGCPNLPAEALRFPNDASDGGCVFAAVRGEGAFTGPLFGAGTDALPSEAVRVRASREATEALFLESVESRHSDHAFSARVAEALGVGSPPLRVDSQAKYGVLSRGDASIYMRFPPADYREKIWDHAAGAVVVEEAGGRVTDATGAPLDFSRGRWLDIDRGIVAAPAELHQGLLEAIAKAGG